MPLKDDQGTHLEVPDDSTLVWRFLDLPKFLSMLHRQELWFSCPSRFPDPWDGHYPRATTDKENIRKWLAEEFGSIPEVDRQAADDEIHKLTELVQSTETTIESLSSFVRDRYGVCCWHISQYEPDAFWTLYSNRSFGVAIKSSVGRLRNALAMSDRLVTIGKVSYKRETEPFFRGGLLKQFFWKRPNFSYESELRLVVPLTSPQSLREFLEHPDLERELREGGAGVSVDISKLIEAVVISPLAPRWFEESVKEMTARFHKELLFEESALRSLPKS